MRLRAYWGRIGWGWKMYGIGDTAATWFVGLTKAHCHLGVYNEDEERTLRHLKRNEEGISE